MNKPSCIVIEDQPVARRIIEQHLENCGLLDNKGSFSSAIDALSYLNENDIDILFLDIEMPVLNGLQMLKTLQRKPLVIVISAYREYALDSYDFDVTDFLLKPISFERFLKAVNKSCEIIKNNRNKYKYDKDFIVVKQDKKIHKLDLESIIYIESMGDYVKFYTSKGVYVAYQTIKNLSEKLPFPKFLKIHKSYIVALDKIESIVGNTIFINEIRLPIGESFRSVVKKIIS